MKNFIKLFGVIALISVIGFTMAACKEEDVPLSILNGTWVKSTPSLSVEKLVMDDGNFTNINNDVELYKGTYTISGNDITVTITQVNGAAFFTLPGFSATQWYTQWFTQQELRTALTSYYKDYQKYTQTEAEKAADSHLDIFTTQNGTYTLEGNTLTIKNKNNGFTDTYTRQQ